MKIAFYSTDFQATPVPDPKKSAITGKQEFVPGQKQMTFGGTFWYRGGMPSIELGKHGYETFVSWEIDSSPDGHLRVMDQFNVWHDDVDAIWVQRQMGENAAMIFERAKAAGQVIINDLDDSFATLPKSNIARQTTDPTLNPHFNREHYYKAIAASSAVTVSTPALYKEAERLNVPVYLCRNAIDIERWPQLDPTTDGMIGWIGGIQWRANDMSILKVNRIPQFLRTYGLPFYHGGDSNVPGVKKAHELAGIDHTQTQCAVAPLTSIQDYPSLWQPMNVSLIPLEDVPFNHAKSALKSLESSVCGLPYISSDLPEQRWFAEHGGMGRLAKNTKPQQWLDNLEDLLDPETRRIEGEANRQHALLFDIRDKWTQWADVFNELGITADAEVAA